MAISKITTKGIADDSVTSAKLAAGAVTANDIPDTEIPFSKLSQVNLDIAPEVLEIQVAAPQAGQDTQWLWTWLTSSLPYARRTITNSPEVQVPLYKQGTYTVNNYAAYDLFDDMTQTHSLYLKWIDGAGTDNLISWATSTGPVSDSHPDINSGSATDVQRISVSVPANITLPTLTPPSVSYTVVNNGAGAYTFSGAARGDNPNIGPMYRGGTYTFNVSATGHPFYFTTDNGTNFSTGTYFGEYTDGVTGSRTDDGTVTIVVPNDAPDTLYYQCGNHNVMRGAITVKDLEVETNNNGNYVVYFQHTQEGHKTPVELRPIPSLVNQMCLVYDANSGKFVPQDLATYVENTPSFENKIREVAGTAELVVEDGSAVVAKVNVYDDSTYLPLTGNNPGDQAFATDTDILYIWDGSAWQQAGAANSDDLTEGSTNLFYTNERVDDRVAALLVGGNNITATYDDAAGTLTIDGQPGYTDTDVGTYLSANGYDTATNIVASITDSAPTTLDTLNELAAALGDDPNFATTVTNNLATKAPINNPTFTGVISGDGSGITNLVFPATTNRYSYTATANQTSFTATYTTNNVDVFLNGIKLVRSSEYDDTSGTAIVLSSGADAGEIVEIIAYENFTVGDAVSASAGGTFSGPITATSFIGDGSQLTGVTSYTNTDLVNYLGSNNVGIGTTSPQARIHAHDPAKTPYAGSALGNASIITSGADGILQLLSVDDDSTWAHALTFKRYRDDTGATISGYGFSTFTNTGNQNANTFDRMGLHYGADEWPQNNAEIMTWKSNGRVGIGSSNPQVSLVVGGTDALQLPIGTTAQRPTGAAGYTRINSTNDILEYHNGTAWVQIGVADGSSYSSAAANASDLVDLGITTSGEYWINLPGAGPTLVYCDMEIDGGGWMMLGYAGSTSGVGNSNHMVFHQIGTIATSRTYGQTSFSRFDYAHAMPGAGTSSWFMWKRTGDDNILVHTANEMYNRMPGGSSGGNMDFGGGTSVPYNITTMKMSNTGNTTLDIKSATAGAGTRYENGPGYPGISWNSDYNNNQDGQGGYNSWLNRRALVYWETNGPESQSQWFHGSVLDMGDGTVNAVASTSRKDVEIYFRVRTP